jgi:hypothetical protein
MFMAGHPSAARSGRLIAWLRAVSYTDFRLLALEAAEKCIL